MSSSDDHLAAQVAEYGRYRAKEQIFLGGALAFNPGDPVPVSHVTRKIVTPDQVDDLKPAGPPADDGKQKGN